LHELTVMKTLLWVLFSAMVGALLFWQVGMAFDNGAGLLVADGAFVLLLAAFAAWHPGAVGRGVAIAAVAAPLLLGACAILGMMVFDGVPWLGNLLMASISVGYYPSGPDVPILPGLGIWAVSLVALILAGLVSGNLVGWIWRRGWSGGEAARRRPPAGEA
jgi:hypothetical protein